LPASCYPVEMKTLYDVLGVLTSTRVSKCIPAVRPDHDCYCNPSRREGLRGLRAIARPRTSAAPVEASPHHHCRHDCSRCGYCRASGRICADRARFLDIHDGERSRRRCGATAGRDRGSARNLARRTRQALSAAGFRANWRGARTKLLRGANKTNALRLSSVNDHRRNTRPHCGRSRAVSAAASAAGGIAHRPSLCARKPKQGRRLQYGRLGPLRLPGELCRRHPPCTEFAAARRRALAASFNIACCRAIDLARRDISLADRSACRWALIPPWAARSERACGDDGVVRSARHRPHGARISPTSATPYLACITRCTA
jgi:hypothetical protein